MFAATEALFQRPLALYSVHSKPRDIASEKEHYAGRAYCSAQITNAIARTKYWGWCAAVTWSAIKHPAALITTNDDRHWLDSNHVTANLLPALIARPGIQDKSMVEVYGMDLLTFSKRWEPLTAVALIETFISAEHIILARLSLKNNLKHLPQTPDNKDFFRSSSEKIS
jgi:hypothetical protein